jgi:hypothetical protein
MSEKDQTFRTSAFYTRAPGSYLYRYWIMSPAFGRPGFQIKVHDEGVNCAGINRIADELPPQEALRQMDRLEQEAAASLRRMDGTDSKKLGPDYQAAESYADHFDATVAETNYDRLRKRRPSSPSFKLKKP